MVVAIVLSLATPAIASDTAMLDATAQVSGVEQAVAAARAGASDRIQLAYDRARNMREALRAAGEVSTSCRTYQGWAIEYADAAAAIASWLDRLDTARARAARTTAATARSRMRSTRAACVPATTLVAAVPTLVEPRPGAAFFEDVVAAAPAGTDAAELAVNGVVAGPLLVRSDGTVWAHLRAGPGKYDLLVRFKKAGAVIGSAESKGVWLLPPSAQNAVKPASLDGSWQRSLRLAAARFRGTSGIWTHQLATGQAATWNAGARFSAASTVKLGVMVEALRRAGATPEVAPTAADVAAIGGWSSNLAVNRLLPGSGGALGAQESLIRMGTTSTTFTGGYKVATARPPVRAVAQPPLSSRRVTTAADLGAVMAMLHRAALGEPAALDATRMTIPQARLALGTLLNSDPRDGNAGLIRQAFGSSVPIAQKNGWLSSSQHTAAIVYTRRGPLVVVVLTTASGLTRTRAATLGTAVVRATTG